MADKLSKLGAELPPVEENKKNSEADATALELKDQDGDRDASLGGTVDVV